MSEVIQLQPGRRYTVEEYFAFEASAEEKHLYLDGEIVAMAGGTGAHAIIMSNVNAELRNGLRGTPCRPVASDLRVRFGRKARYGYSDGLVVCGPFQYDAVDGAQLTLLNPTLVIEVLSPSSERFDRGKKFELYREIESLREYVLISQDQPRVEVFYRQDDGAWRIAVYEGLDEVIVLSSLKILLNSKEVFADVSFPPSPPEPKDGVIVAPPP